MTVMLGFTSEKHKVSFLGADDLEAMSGQKEDKVNLFFKRFLVGGVGTNVVYKAANVLKAFENLDTFFSDGSQFEYPKSISSFCEAVATILPIVARHTYRGLENATTSGRLTQKQADLIKTMRNDLYLIDTKEFRICHAAFDLVYPVKENYGFQIVVLPASRLFRFGIDEATDLGGITEEMRQPSLEWVGRRLNEAKQEVASGGGDPDLIGELGACYLSREGRIIRRTIHTSLKAVALRYFPPPG